MPPLASLHRRLPAVIGWLMGLLASPGCGGDHMTSVDAAVDAPTPIDLCDAFTGVGTACPRAGPLICFPMCEAGGCFCQATPSGPQWACVTDRSCQQACAPLDEDACAEASSGTGSD